MMNSILERLWQAVRHMSDTVVSRLPALAVALIVFFSFYILSVFLARLIRRTVSRQRQNLAVVFARLTEGATILLGLLVALAIVAPSFQASDLIKILGIGGVAIGFAFQNILQNFLAGLLLLWTEPFRVGDEIKLDAFEGRVEEIQTRATIIKTYDERRVVIPNADLFTHSVVVNTALGSRRWQYDLNVGKASRIEELKDRIVEGIRSVPGVLPDPSPEALIVDVTSDAAKLRILWSTHEPGQHQMLASYDRVLTEIWHVLDEFQSGQEQHPVHSAATN
jgi:small-conductance mechanosensitive channel